MSDGQQAGLDAVSSLASRTPVIGAEGDASTPSCLSSSNDAQGNPSKVAEHYNAVPDKGITARLDSRILYLRNFNNWMKSMLINEFLEKLKASGCSRATVLDLCCGKGGDLLKWRNVNIAHVVATDIADISLQQCEGRYNEMKERSDGRQSLFTAEFILADATKVRLVDRYSNKDILFDLCSCQFSFHYSFETERQARQMIRNVAERLRPGGYFIGTLPDANRILHCLRKGDTGVYSNDVLRIEYGDKEALKDPKHCPPVFGAMFHFSLDTQVNCPEYLVHFGVLEKLLSECGLDLVYVKSFPDAFNSFKDDQMGRGLLQKMKALEAYPSEAGSSLLGGAEEYATAETKIQEMSAGDEGMRRPVIGTLSRSEWEVVSMYLVFAFRKR